ncbi:MAG TPA: TonB-dependent receptor [Bryobacteraceae bacterium]|nr:TonB-dependent receptor [Bryobacteraceae bacterium]
MPLQGFNRRNAGISAAAAIVLMMWTAGPASPQAATGRVFGTVSDPGGAVVAGAKVTVTNVATSVRWDTTTRPDGTYQVLELPIGNYSVSVQAQGFGTAVTQPAELQINQSLRIDVTLAIGQLTQTVSVESQATQVETVVPTIGGTVVGAAVQELPLNGRDTLTLASTLPGISGNPTGTGQAAGTNFSIAGGRLDAVSYLLDGANNNSVTSNGVTFDPNPDTVAEFRILMNNYTAEYGRSAGGIVSVVTKSGTNQLHGSLFNYLRNEDLNANDFFANLTGAPVPVLKRNQFGVTLGGPVVLPKVVNGRDKFFFFFGYQGQRQISTSVGSLTPTYTPAELMGDFSHAVNGGPDPAVVTFLQNNPYYQGNAALAAKGVIDPSKLDPVFLKYAQAGVIPTSPTGVFLPQMNVPNNTDEFTGKFDILPSTTDHISVLLGHNNNPYNASLGGGFTGGANVGFPSTNILTSSLVTISYTKTITPALLNEARASVNRFEQVLNSPAATLPQPNALGVGINSDDPNGPTVIGLTGGPTMGFNGNEGHKADNTFSYGDTLTWIKGNHTFRGGVTFAAAQENSHYEFYVNGDFLFYGPYTLVGSGNSLADFEFGLPDEYFQYPSAIDNLRQKQFATFFQDEWKVTPRLLLTLGVRYEYSTPQEDTLGRSFSLLPGEQSTRFAAAPVGAVFPGDPGAPRGLYFPDKTNFSPRLGFAWDPLGKAKTSIRGGFGMFYSVLNGWDMDENNGVAPYYAGVDFGMNGYNGLAGPVTAAPQFLENPYAANGLVDPFPSHQTLTSNDPNLFNELGAIPFGSSEWMATPHLRTPYVYQYNLSVQQQLAKDLVLEVGYSGSDSHDLITLEDGNPMILGTNVRILNASLYPYYYSPAFGGITDNGFSALPNFITNDGRANYNGLLSSLTKRNGDWRGFGTTFFTVAYTYAHNIDNSTGNVNNAAGGVPYYDHDALRGNSQLDQRQRFTISGGWELPFDKAWDSGPKALTRGWTLYPIFSWYTGLPFDVSAALPGNTPVNNIPGPSGAGDTGLARAEQVTPTVQTYTPGSTHVINGQAGLYYINPSDFTVPSEWTSPNYIPAPDQRTYGMPRDSIPGIGLVNLDLAIVKRTALFHERVNTELRVESFNTLNHPNFASPGVGTGSMPINTITSSLFGQITQTVTGTGRVGQIALRVTF